MNDSIDAICGGLGVLRSISLIRFADGALRCQANVRLTWAPFATAG